MKNIGKELRKKLEGVGERNQSAAKRIPFVGGLVEDIIFVFESIVTAIEELEKRIDELEKK